MHNNYYEPILPLEFKKYGSQGNVLYTRKIDLFITLSTLYYLSVHAEVELRSCSIEEGRASVTTVAAPLVSFK